MAPSILPGPHPDCGRCNSFNMREMRDVLGGRSLLGLGKPKYWILAKGSPPLATCISPRWCRQVSHTSRIPAIGATHLELCAALCSKGMLGKALRQPTTASSLSAALASCPHVRACCPHHTHQAYYLCTTWARACSQSYASVDDATDVPRVEKGDCQRTIRLHYK